MKLLQFFLYHLGYYFESALVALIMMDSAAVIIALVWAPPLYSPLVAILSILLIVYWMTAAVGTIFNPLRHALQDWKDYRKGKKNDKKR